MDQAPLHLQEPAVESSPTVLCPGCGYDLRGTTGDRCSECGLVLDRAALKHSGFPWAHRARLGPLRAFVKTVWLVTSDSEILRYEAARSGIARDADVFRRWIGVLLTACFATIVIMLVDGGAVADAAVDRSSRFQRLAGWAGPSQDLLVPWSAGITLRPALFACAAALAFYLAGATRPIFRTRGLAPDYADTVATIGGYVVAPLAFLVPATAGYAMAGWFHLYDEFGLRPTPLAPALVLASLLLFLLAIGATVYRTGQWRARTAHAGYPTIFLAMAELLLRWAVGAAVLLFVVPWCVGLIWIAIDSFRG